MNWKQEAREQLGAYECSRNALKSLRLMAKQIELELTSPPPQRMDAPIHSSGGCDDFRLNRLVQLEQLRSRIRHTELWLEAVEGALGVLSRDERLVLNRFFIQPQKCAAELLCQELNMERSAVYRLRDRSLERFTTALYGIGL